MSSTTISPEDSPRNPWLRLSQAVEDAQAGRVSQARDLLDSVRYHPAVPSAVFDVYDGLIAHGAGTRLRVETPADYLRGPVTSLRVPFRQVTAGTTPPAPFPKILSLPQLVGPRNDSRFLRDAAFTLPGIDERPGRRVHVLIDAARTPDPGQVLQQLADQDGDSPVHVTLFGVAQGRAAPSGPAGGRLTVEAVADPILSPAASAQILRIAEDAEDGLLIFLGGDLHLEPTVLSRAQMLTRCGDALALPLVEADGALLAGATAQGGGPFTSAYPFRETKGLNLAVTAGMLRRAGSLEPGFTSPDLAARELAFRVQLAGGYLAPLPVRKLSITEAWTTEDRQLYVALCPNHWDRKTDGTFARPRVSIYIPAYNAARYIRQAVDSVLDQDLSDLEVCICDDGSLDDTLDVLEANYADDPRVRWVSTRNGGIGHASNVAVRMCRAPFVGQLDSDDRLLPGAVRRLVEYLETHPETACVYGSCERVDADGNFVKNEYSWPVFSREKMMVTSITHHFRMFRKSAWERTGGFRDDIINGIDYDVFLKLSETGAFHHIDEIMYQRRWHGLNTSMVNEAHQTANTHRVQTEALKRLGLDPFWEVHVPDPAQPRRITYRRRAGTKGLMFWPNYSAFNPYQSMIYADLRKRRDVFTGDIEAALEQLEGFRIPGDLTFHLHWLNEILRDVTDRDEAERRAEAFLSGLRAFTARGGDLVWTIHNHCSHDTPFADIEIRISTEIARLARVVHVHDAAHVDEAAALFPLPREKVAISPHGHYVGAYPNFVSRDTARSLLGLDAEDEVILFIGQVRPYKGVQDLIAAFRALLPERPRLRLVIAGEAKTDPLAGLDQPLTPQERDRITVRGQFVDDLDMQVFLRAADLAVFPYRQVLTSGSLLLALSFGVPAIIPDRGAARRIIDSTGGGRVYDPDDPDGLRDAIHAWLSGSGSRAGDAAALRSTVEAELGWPDFEETVLGHE